MLLHHRFSATTVAATAAGAQDQKRNPLDFWKEVVFTAMALMCTLLSGYLKLARLKETNQIYTAYLSTFDKWEDHMNMLCVALLPTGRVRITAQIILYEPCHNYNIMCRDYNVR